MQVKSIVILGGGTAGWMAAAALSKCYQNQNVNICLIESSGIPPVGVGEATVPGIHQLHSQLEIPEPDFMRATGATFKLGIEFDGWHRPGSRFFHPFGAYGAKIANQDFYQCWLKLHREGIQFNLEDFSLARLMAKENRFAQPDFDSKTPLALYNYAYHFDAVRYGQYLREWAEKWGVIRIEGHVDSVIQHPESGYIRSLELAGGQSVKGDLFIDCTGFAGLLINQCLGVEFQSWESYLPCDSAVVAQTDVLPSLPSYTLSRALSAGWQWRIPLVHRTGNGYVYASRYISDDEAKDEFIRNLDGEPLTEPRVIRFRAGMRKRFWDKNCVALGLASGFLEPLESTSISLIQTGIDKLIHWLPDRVIKDDNRDEANRLNRAEYQRIRDFLILHYLLNKREDSNFWRSAATMDIPASLAKKIEAFDRDGSILLFEQESFQEASWLSMYNGFCRRPSRHKLKGTGLGAQGLQQVMQKMRSAIAKAVVHAPLHREFINQVYES